MKEVLLKTTSFCRVTLDKDVGYIIRPINVRGAVIAVNLDGNIQIGQSQNTCYPREVWFEVQKEIQCGITYMAKVRMIGWNEKLFVATKHIPIKSYTNNTIYEKSDGDFVWYIGEGYLERFMGGNSCGSSEGGGIMYANFPHVDILGYTMVNDILILQTSDNNFVYDVIYFRTRKTEPRDFVRKLCCFPVTARGIAVGDIDHVVVRWFYDKDRG